MVKQKQNDHERQNDQEKQIVWEKQNDRENQNDRERMNEEGSFIRRTTPWVISREGESHGALRGTKRVAQWSCYAKEYDPECGLLRHRNQREIAWRIFPLIVPIIT